VLAIFESRPGTSCERGAIDFLVTVWVDQQEPGVKKGRHRRFEEARALKRSSEAVVETCPECNAMPGDDHATWCRAMEDDDEEYAESAESPEHYSDRGAQH
jgi:hypothetical protein